MALFWIGAIIVISSMIFYVVAYILRYRVSFFEKIFKFKFLSALLQAFFPFLGMFLISLFAKIAYPLGNDFGILEMVIDSLSETFKLYSFEIKSECLQALVSEGSLISKIFLITNLLFVFSLYFSLFFVFCENFLKYLRNTFRVKKALKQDCDIVVGYNSSIEYVNSYLKNSYKSHQIIVWDNTLTEEQELELLGKRIPIIKEEFNLKNLNKQKFLYNFENKINIISFNDEVTNIKYV